MRGELTAIDEEDVKFLEDGTGRLLIRRSKTDQAGEWHVAHLSRESVLFVKAWLNAARIKDRPVFRRIVGRGTVTYHKQGKGWIGERLSPEAVSRAFKAVARYWGLATEDIEGGQWAFGAGGGDAGFVGVECGFGVCDAGGEMEERAHADAVWGACDGGAGWDGQGGEGTGEGWGVNGWTATISRTNLTSGPVWVRKSNIGAGTIK